MQILNQSQTALNLPNFTQCLKKFVFPSKKGVKTAQVASQRELRRDKGGGSGVRGRYGVQGKKMGKAAETLTG